MSWYIVLFLIATPTPGMLGTPYPQFVAYQAKGYATEALCTAAAPAFLAARSGGVGPVPAANQKFVLGCVQW